MAYLTVNGKRLERDVNFSDQPIIKGGENMKKIYQAVILNTELDQLEGTQWVTAKDKEQAFAKVDLTDHSIETVKVFLNKIGEYK